MSSYTIESELHDVYGVSLKEMAEIVIDQQSKYNSYTIPEAISAILKVTSKKEVIHAYQVAFLLDEYAQQAKDVVADESSTFDESDLNDLTTTLINDDPLFGIDETIAMSMSGLYGSIATTNYGYLDKAKPGVIGRLNDMGKSGELVTTMIDDVVAATIACAEAYLSHNAINQRRIRMIKESYALYNKQKDAYFTDIVDKEEV